MLVLWGSRQLGRWPPKAPKDQDPLVVTVGWGSPDAAQGAEKAPIPESFRYLTDRLTAIADTACNYREYHTMQMPDNIKIDAQHDGLVTVAKSIRELIIELTGRDPWVCHPPAAAP